MDIQHHDLFWMAVLMFLASMLVMIKAVWSLYLKPKIVIYAWDEVKLWGFHLQHTSPKISILLNEKTVTLLTIDKLDDFVLGKQVEAMVRDSVGYVRIFQFERPIKLRKQLMKLVSQRQDAR